MIEKNLKILPRFSDSASFLYIEHAVVERQDSAIVLYREEGAISVPAAGINTCILGPGTRITHGAIVVLSEAGASIVWSGSDALKFFAAGFGKTRSATGLLKQVYAFATEHSRLAVVRRLYNYRFSEDIPDTLSLQQIRGREGARVRDAYALASRTFGVEWHGRNYSRDSWSSSDPVNRALSTGASCLYGICHAGIVARGFSPAIGFIHQGKQLSFVYDIADLYKVEVLIPAAFKAAAEGAENIESRTRKLLREHLHKNKILDRIVADLDRLFDQVENDSMDDSLIEQDDAPGTLWDPDGNVIGGKNYDSNDS